MASVSIDEVRAVVKTGMTDAELGDVIDRAEFELSELCGQPQDSELSVSEVETVYGGTQNLFMRRKISSITSIVEDDTTLTTDYFRVFPRQGRIVRLPLGGVWGDEIVITYVPAENLPLFKQATIDLVRNVISRISLKSESIAGEYSYTAADWQKEAQVAGQKLYFKSF
jgi:hypothetical protein